MLVEEVINLNWPTRPDNKLQRDATHFCKENIYICGIKALQPQMTGEESGFRGAKSRSQRDESLKMMDRLQLIK